MCFGLGLLGSLFGSGQKKVAKETAKAAQQDAQASRWAAEASQQALEATVNRNNAADKAANLLKTPVEDVTVQVGQDDDELTPDSGRRRKRSAFRMQTPQSGLRL